MFFEFLGNDILPLSQHQRATKRCKGFNSMSFGEIFNINEPLIIGTGSCTLKTKTLAFGPCSLLLMGYVKTIMMLLKCSLLLAILSKVFFHCIQKRRYTGCLCPKHNESTSCAYSHCQIQTKNLDVNWKLVMFPPKSPAAAANSTL